MFLAQQQELDWFYTDKIGKGAFRNQRQFLGVLKMGITHAR
jgi:hypothetical protein